MLLTINALNGDVALADPNPIDLGLSITVTQGNTLSYSVTTGELERLAPLLADLESRTVAGAPLMTWSVGDDSAQDSRAKAEPSAAISYLGAAAISVAGVASLAIHGSSLQAGQTKAAGTIGGVVYTAVGPGSTGNQITVTHVVAGLNTALSVSADLNNNITVNLATDGTGAATSTQSQVSAAIAANGMTKNMVTAGTGATVASAAAKTNLTGGKGAGISVKVAGLSCVLLDISDTIAHVDVPALTGVTATWPVTLQYLAGLQAVQISSTTSA